MADLRGTTAVLGITSTLVLSGIHIATSLLFVPRMSTLPLATSTALFDRLYHDGVQVVLPLAGLAIASFGYLAATPPYHSARPASSSSSSTSTSVVLHVPPLAVAAGLVVSTLVWTRVVVMPVNDQLLGMARDARRREDAGPAVVETLLRKWRWMNYVRGFVALGAGVLALTTMV